jgi:hypothetical protein
MQIDLCGWWLWIWLLTLVPCKKIPKRGLRLHKDDGTLELGREAQRGQASGVIHPFLCLYKLVTKHSSLNTFANQTLTSNSHRNPPQSTKTMTIYEYSPLEKSGMRVLTLLPGGFEDPLTSLLTRKQFLPENSKIAKYKAYNLDWARYF